MSGTIRGLKRTATMNCTRGCSHRSAANPPSRRRRLWVRSRRNDVRLGNILILLSCIPALSRGGNHLINGTPPLFVAPKGIQTHWATAENPLGEKGKGG